MECHNCLENVPSQADLTLCTLWDTRNVREERIDNCLLCKECIEFVKEKAREIDMRLQVHSR